LGNGGQSRLWDRIREREGLSYNVYAAISWSSVDRLSWWTGGAIFAPGNRAKVEAAFKEELERARTQGFNSKELEQAKGGLLSFRSLARAQDSNLASAWARNLHLERTFARSAQMDAQIRALTLEQVNAALRKYIDPSQLLWGVAGDFKD
jgi:zinc protease